EYSNGYRVGSLHCTPAPEGTLTVSDLYISSYPNAVGQHDAGDITYDCSLSLGGCDGVGDVVVWVQGSSTSSEVSTYYATSKTGTFTLDAFTQDGGFSGSLDLTASQNGVVLAIKGHFAANL